mgnify:CR=1 FL=1
MTTAEAQKRAAAGAALDFVEDGMLVGLGTGSTARHFTLGLGERLERGELRDVTGVPTSLATEALARQAGVPLAELPAGGVDLAVDGMDEVDANLDAVKGLGGALTREKIVAASAGSFILIGDESKVVDRLTSSAPVPVEVIPFGWRRTLQLLAQLELDPSLRGGEDDPFRTDNGNLVVDCTVRHALSPARLAADLSALPGVVDHGLFLQLAARALIAGADGVRELVRK